MNPAFGAAIRTTCPYCGVGCGVEVSRLSDSRYTVRGDPLHPANRGRLCSKGAALAETLDERDRLLVPRVAGRDTDWESAFDQVADGFRRTLIEHGPESVALYVSGQLLTEDYYVANKFVKGLLGTANIDTNSRLCMASSVAGHKRAFGSDTVPGCYEDLEQANLVVLVGSNLAWCHPVLYQRLMAARSARPTMQVLVIDPRRTATADSADRHLALDADSDLALFGGLLRYLERHEAIDEPYLDAHVDGWQETLRSVAALDVASVARLTGLDAVEIERFYRLFAAEPRTVTLYSQGINQGEHATESVNAIINCHLATGRVGRPGAGPFSITGQPNAMGGREVGGLSNTLAAHVDFDDELGRERIRAFWGYTSIASTPGPKAVELFERVHDGRIRALWILATNPVDSVPDADRVRRAIQTCPFVVVSDVTADSDTARLADVLLPSAAWSEKDGTVTNSERCLSRQRAFRSPPGQALADWRQIAAVARRLGGGATFDWSGPDAVFREHAALSAVARSGSFDIGSLASLDRDAYDRLRPEQWPLPNGVSEPGAAQRQFIHGRFHTPSGRARCWPIHPAPVLLRSRPASATAAVPSSTSSTGKSNLVSRAPFSMLHAERVTLNTGRIRDQWHTMTRTGSIERLMLHLGEPFVELHPVDAARRGIHDAELVELDSDFGYVRLRALLTDRQPRGTVFVPIHWSDHYASSARVAALVPPRLDPISGQPASKSARVNLRRWPANAYGFVVCRGLPTQWPDRDRYYWARAPVAGGVRIEIGGCDGIEALAQVCARMTNASLSTSGKIELAEFHDRVRGLRRWVATEEGRLIAAAFLATGPVKASRNWLATSIGSNEPDASVWLAGQPAAAIVDGGAIVCSCFAVGSNTLRNAIRRDGCRTLEDLGQRLQAGTHCGSCRPELARLLVDEADRVAAPARGVDIATAVERA